MAGLKKPSRKKDNSSPNLVLVIFLVFFILVSIGLGVWGYYGYAGQEKLTTDAKNAKIAEKVKEEMRAYQQLMAFDLMQALGKLDPDKIGELNDLRTQFEGGKFKDEKAPPPETAKGILDATKKDLGFDNGKYSKNYSQLVTELNKAIGDKDGTIASLQTQLKETQDKFRELQTNQDKQHKEVSVAIAEGNAAVLKQSRANRDTFTKAVEQNNELSKKIKDDQEEFSKMEQQLKTQNRIRDQKLMEMEQKRTELVGATRNPTDVHALLLDISTGKTLWDRPLGKILRVEMAQRRAVINLGSATGVQPETTFSVFGTGPYGGAEKHLKGTLEVMKVIDANTSVARITSLYSADGHEINLNDTGLLRIQRESESALREGDLLFNMFWGQPVAIAGPASLVGTYTDSPAEQMRRLTDFIHFADRLGMPVDAYLDLADKEIKGKITWNTRYLVLGGNLHTPTNEADADRVKLINEAIEGMKKEAIDKGLFIISAENFLTVAGYRAPRSANLQREVATFRPGLPKAGQAAPGLYLPGRQQNAAPEVGAPEAPAAPGANEEKKAMEKEEKKVEDKEDK